MMKEIQSFFEIDDRLCALAEQAEERCKPVFAAIDQRAAYNGAKVLKAFQNNRVSEPCFYGSTGYGYGDQGREVLDKVVAEAFGAEDALVRHNFVSGTHALTVALFGVLRTGDKMVSITGRPYDTLEGVIGLTGNKGDGSLMDYGVTYDEVPLLEDGTPNYDAIPEAVRGAKIAYIQRSRGYALRPAFTLAQIEKMAQLARSSNPDIIVMVDNCYGEFTDTSEPVQHGADLMIGSMIKNVGGGIARTGGYIAGRKDLVELCSYRLTCVGMGKEVGCTLDMNRELFLGFFHAPDVTASALKTAAFAASLFELLGFACYPRYDEPRNDIVEAICLGDEAHLTAFVRAFRQVLRWIPLLFRKLGICRAIPARSSWQLVHLHWVHPSNFPQMLRFENRLQFGCRAALQKPAEKSVFCLLHRKCWKINYSQRCNANKTVKKKHHS